MFISLSAKLILFPLKLFQDDQSEIEFENKHKISSRWRYITLYRWLWTVPSKIIDRGKAFFAAYLFTNRNIYFDTLFVFLLDQSVPIVYEPHKVALPVIPHSSHIKS